MQDNSNVVVGVADEGTNVVGAPLPQDQVSYKPMLSGFGPEKVVTVYNPLPNDFRFQHARTVIAQPELDKDRATALEKGLDMRKDQNPVSHFSQYYILKAGESKNLPGDIAQKAVQDLTTYILMQRAGKGNAKNVADGYARAEVEKELVIAVHDNTVFYDTVSPQEATKRELDNLNAPTTVEKEPKAVNPPPGQGVSYEPKPNSPSTKATAKA